MRRTATKKSEDGYPPRVIGDNIYPGDSYPKVVVRSPCARAGERNPGRIRVLFHVVGLVPTLALGLVGGCEAGNLDGPIAAAHVFWSVGTPTLGPPAVDDSMVYFSTRAHSVIAVRRRSGGVKWTGYCCTGGDWTYTSRSPVLAGSTLVFGDYDLAGFDARSGALLWRFDSLPGMRLAAGADLFQADSGTVYTGSDWGVAFALNATTGTVLWRTDLNLTAGNQVRVHAVRDGRVYATLRYNSPYFYATAYALDAATGAVLWMHDMGRSSIADDVVLTPATETPQLFLVTLDDGSIEALDPTSGQQVWLIGRPSDAYLSDRRMTIANGLLVASSTANSWTNADAILGYDLGNGAERWRIANDQGSVGGYYNDISNDGVQFYATFLSGVLGTFNMATGSRQSLRRAPTGLFNGAPIVSHDTLFIAGSDGAYAISK